MKTCPSCNRTYTDESLSFCLDDGTPLVGSSGASSFDPQATLMLSNPQSMQTFQQEARPTNEGAQFGVPAAPPVAPAQDQQPRQGGPGTVPPSVNAYGAPQATIVASQSVPAYQPAPTPPSWDNRAGVAQKKKRGMLPFVIGGILLLLLGGAAIAVIGFVIYFNSSNTNANNGNSTNENANNGNQSADASPSPTTEASASPTVPEGGTGGTVVKSSDGATQITIPSGWSQVSDLNKVASIQASNPAQNLYLIVISNSKADLGSMTLDKFAESTFTKLYKTLSDAQTSGPDTLTINGYPAIRYQVTGEISGSKAVYFHTSVQTSGHLHQVVAWTLESQLDESKPVFEEIINSFKEQ